MTVGSKCHRILFSDVASAGVSTTRSAPSTSSSRVLAMAAMVTSLGDSALPDEFEAADVLGSDQ